MSNSTKTWFTKITLKLWTGLRKLAQKVHENGWQYFFINELKTAIEPAWYELHPEFIQNFVMSKANCITEVKNVMETPLRVCIRKYNIKI